VASPAIKSWQVKTETAMVRLLDGDRIVERLRKGKTFEAACCEQWVKYCGPGKVTVDVGAYSGLYAMLSAQLGACSIAIEPLEEMQEQLQRNLELNQLRVKVIAAAASNENGTRELFFNQYAKQTSAASFHPRKKEYSSVTVKTITIDSLRLHNVSIMKLDVERHEPQVLEGSEQTLIRCNPALIVEALDNDSLNKIMAVLPVRYRVSAELDSHNLLLESV
jgi:FkbM family methyltransferase